MRLLTSYLVGAAALHRTPTSSIQPTRTRHHQPTATADHLNRHDQQADTDPYLELPAVEYLDGTKPASSWQLATDNFARQAPTILTQALERVGLAEPDALRPPTCLGLKLSNAAVAEAEARREASGGRVDAHPVSRGLYDLGCALLDNLFDGRPIQRFWFLETVARIPYFAYVSMLHLYESLGWWRAVELRKVHNAEEWNELHHLLIMEALGGNALWSDRFLGYHAAIAYYWFLIAVYLCSPRIAYQFMELLEAHAVDTYSTFIEQNSERLEQLPPPKVARSYYKEGDLYLFDDFQQLPAGTRRPPCDSLLDVFRNICEDEAQHVKTMQACQDYAKLGSRVVSPHAADVSASPEVDAASRRRRWQEWSEAVNTVLPEGAADESALYSDIEMED